MQFFYYYRERSKTFIIHKTPFKAIDATTSKMRAFVTFEREFNWLDCEFRKIIAGIEAYLKTFEKKNVLYLDIVPDRLDYLFSSYFYSKV